MTGWASSRPHFTPPQFSLRTLLIVVAVLCLGLAWLGNRLQRQWATEQAYREADRVRQEAFHKEKLERQAVAEAIDKLMKLGGKYRGQSDDNYAIFRVTDSDLVHLESLTKLQQLILSNTQITDTGLVHLDGLANLSWLNLNMTQVTDEGVRKLQQALPNCQIIY